MKRKFLIYGSGVIGSTYGALLAKSGQDVTMLARGNRLLDLKKNGLLISSVNQSSPEKIPVEIIDGSVLTDRYDYVLVTLRNEQVKAALPSLAGIKTDCFVFMVNSSTGYSEWIDALGYDRVLPAFPGSGGKIENGIVYYKIVNRAIQPTTLGEISGRISARVRELKTMLANAGFHVSVSPDMDAWQKTHVALVAPLADVIYFDGGNNYSVAKNKTALAQLTRSLRENFEFLHHSDIGIVPFKLHFFRLTPFWLLNVIMKYAYNTAWAEAVICNHALNARLEMEAVSREFLEMAKSKGFELKEFEKLFKSI